MADEDKRAGIVLKREVQRLDRLHVQVIGRLVHNHDVGLLQNQSSKHQATLLTTRSHLDGFFGVIARKQHASERAQQQLLVAVFGAPLTHPVKQTHVLLKLIRVVLCVVAGFSVFGPLDRTAIHLDLTQQTA